MWSDGIIHRVSFHFKQSKESRAHTGVALVSSFRKRTFLPNHPSGCAVTSIRHGSQGMRGNQRGQTATSGFVTTGN